MEERVTFRLPTWQLAQIDATAAAHGTTRSRVIRGICEDAFDSAEAPGALAELFADEDRELARLREIVGD